MSDQRTPGRARKSTGAESSPTHQDDTIFSAMHSAGEFYKLSTNMPSVVNEISLDPPDPGMPRSLWLRRAFGEWLDDFCARFACSREVVEKISTIIEMAWYGTGSPERRAPGWLIGWPKAVEREIILAAPERLAAASTWEIEKAILARVKTASMRSVGDLAANPSKTVRSDKFSKRIAELMAAYRGKPYREILGMIDGEDGLEIPKRFKKHEHCSQLNVMVGAYDCKKCGHSVENFMFQIRKPLGLPRAPKSRRRGKASSSPNAHQSHRFPR